ncbi:NADP-dependent 3-hydroxy acid dehydrogenase YdfG [Pedobacter psychrotolerans]|uniref:NADP-dependent 3-hydroxy acid dehydrogenase YdfG n=1 Tax=Pedobacter psychrotolerans TaxID=1843235 RepID=A0A4R2H7H4_9SPHI|nr:SDR family NAD(P)-dependent oxidoreductase [Pedobacter psychrotolerans]TCO22386.1 NADP-dependent 3-hydroxy acid dehydrogenase YdfG [Pedobacter psychrotolerans]GGE64204.1 short-chain dehydrogenase/reductase [Pedobacter psychrotolerans]
MGLKKVWFITGASKGLGLSLVNQLLKAGQYVAATSRNINELASAVNSNSEKFLPLTVNLSDELSVEQAINATITQFGRIDVVINNAGYGIGGSIEELTDKETRDNFDVNVFGTLNVIRKALPHLRAQKSGHIINISSIAGINGATGWAIYAATKAAVIAFSEVLAEDVKAFGIKVTVVAPGAFRTSFLKPESLILTENPIEDYEDVRTAHARYLKMDGVQAGDPEKAAAAMISLASMPNPPVHLLLGNDALIRATSKLDALLEEIQIWKAITISTDLDE